MLTLLKIVSQSIQSSVWQNYALVWSVSEESEAMLRFQVMLKTAASNRCIFLKDEIMSDNFFYPQKENRSFVDQTAILLKLGTLKETIGKDIRI